MPRKFWCGLALAGATGVAACANLQTRPPRTTPAGEAVQVLEKGPVPAGCTSLGPIHMSRGALQDRRVLEVDLRNEAAAKGGNLVLITQRTTFAADGEIHQCPPPPPPAAAAPSAPAPADEMPTLDARARELFVSGRDAYNAGQYEDALRYFRAAYQLSGRPELQYNVGQAADKLHRDAEALEAFEAYLKTAPAGDRRSTTEARAAQLRTAVGSAAASR